MHDLGKYREEVQRRIEGRAGIVDHASAGAIEVARLVPGPVGRALQAVVAGHHTGLPNGLEEPGGRRLSLRDRLRGELGDCSAWRSEIVVPSELPGLGLRPREGFLGFQAALFVRMLFSCLVDADHTDAEIFHERGRVLRRDPPLIDLRDRLAAHLAQLELGSADSRAHGELLAACREGADLVPGLFSLTVPGDDAALAALAFALEHAVAHRLERVIRVVPFASLVEESAGLLRGVLGRDAVVEDPGGYGVFRASGQLGSNRRGRASWDAALVVTTSARLTEALFASRPVRCRRLHRLARSVIILDDLHAVPLGIVRPFVAALDELARNYGASVVVGGAGSPAVLETDEASGFRGGLRGVRALAPQRRRIRRRVERLGELDDAALAGRLADHHQVLCIVDSRRHARELLERLNGPGCFHVSGAMCPRHRRRRIEEIRAAHGRCLVIATPAIEAASSLRFPVVYRAEAGLDELARAAARFSPGRLRVFRATGHPRQGEPARRAQIARIVARGHGDPLSPDAIADFWRELYRAESSGVDDGLDRFAILPRLEAGLALMLFPFEAIARDVASITRDRFPVLVPFDDHARRLAARIEGAERPGALVGRLRPCLVQVSQADLERLQDSCAVRWLRADRLGQRLSVLVDPNRYRDDVGLV